MECFFYRETCWRHPGAYLSPPPQGPFILLLCTGLQQCFSEITSMDSQFPPSLLWLGAIRSHLLIKLMGPENLMTCSNSLGAQLQTITPGPPQSSLATSLFSQKHPTYAKAIPQSLSAFQDLLSSKSEGKPLPPLQEVLADLGRNSVPVIWCLVTQGCPLWLSFHLPLHSHSPPF